MTSLKFLEAVKFATLKHGAQRRKAANRTHVPYMVHPLEVCEIILETYEKVNQDVLIAAILHDVLEDTDATEQDILGLFGPKVLDFVKENTDNKTLDKATIRTLQISKAPTKSIGAAIIKCADKTSNLRDIVRLPPPWKLETMEAYVEHALQVVINLPIVKVTKDENLIAAFFKAYNDAKAMIAELKIKEQNEQQA